MRLEVSERKPCEALLRKEEHPALGCASCHSLTLSGCIHPEHLSPQPAVIGCLVSRYHLTFGGLLCKVVLIFASWVLHTGPRSWWLYNVCLRRNTVHNLAPGPGTRAWWLTHSSSSGLQDTDKVSNGRSVVQLLVIVSPATVTQLHLYMCPFNMFQTWWWSLKINVSVRLGSWLQGFPSIQSSFLLCIWLVYSHLFMLFSSE